MIVTVLRSGGDFGPVWVQKLAAQCDRWAPGVPFVCLSDMVVPGVATFPLRFGWPGWWAKLELFRPELRLPDHALYLDLDTLVVGDPSDLLAYRGGLALLRDWFPPHQTSTGVMSLGTAASRRTVWAAWTADADGHMARLKGDAEVVRRAPHGDLSALFPGQIATVKEPGAKPGRLQMAPSMPDGARLICGHGRPRFSSPAAGWAHELWRAA